MRGEANLNSNPDPERNPPNPRTNPNPNPSPNPNQDDEQFGLCVAALRALLAELAKTAQLCMEAYRDEARDEAPTPCS